jgi:hypothetical protein
MPHGVSIAHAKRLATRHPAEHMLAARVGGDGRLRAELHVGVDEAGLRRDRGQDVRAVLFDRSQVGAPVPLPTTDGRHAVAFPLSAHPRKEQDVCCLRLDVRLAEQAGADVGIIVERVRGKRAPAIAALALACAGVSVAWLLGAWGDPSARKGHYEGKTREEIQTDLDADVAWHSMEISVASRVSMPEGSTSCELRVENVESNHCDQRVRVWESGRPDDVLFESGAIAPGEYLQSVELAHPLPVGEHTLTVQFQGYERQPSLVSDEGVVLGHDTFGASCAAEVTVEVTPSAK